MIERATVGKSREEIDCAELERRDYFRRHGRKAAVATTTRTVAATPAGKPWYGLTAQKKAYLKSRGLWEAHVKEHPHHAEL